MARIKNVFYLLFFGMCFLIGITIGKMMDDDPPPPSDTQFPIIASQNENVFLIVGVDDLSQPLARLESVWLVTLKSDNAQIALLPLYPVAAAPYLSAYLSPHAPILVPTTNFEYLSGIEVIHKQVASWSGVIMLDLVGLNIVVEIAGERHNPVSVNDDYQNINLPKVWEDPANTLQKQENIIMFLCENSQPFFSHENIQYLITYIPDHYRSTMSTDDLWGQWQLLSNIKFDLTCQYSWPDNP
jgi:hypothetical protein